MLYKRNPQLNKHGELVHLLSIEGLPKGILTHILDTAANFTSVSDREVKKVPLLRGKSVFNLFFENSTRTRTTFEIAAKRLSADVFNLDIARSSASKGESLLDTIANLSAMAADIFVVRHGESGAPYLIAQHVAPPFDLLTRMVTLRAHLDDVPATNAPLLIAPGSHAEGRVPVDVIEQVVSKCGTRVCTADAGDLWLYATPILHASEAASRPAHRRVLQIDFSADELPGGLEWLGV